MNVDQESYTIEELTQALIGNLTKQEQKMIALKKHIDEQLTAVRAQERDALDTLTAETSSIVNALQLLQNEKNSHIQLFSTLLDMDTSSTSTDAIIEKLKENEFDEELTSTLKQLFERIPLNAQAIRESSKELAYSLQYALHLGHQMIEAIQGAVSYPPILIYTAEGSKKLSASKRMMVNKVG
ncbi:MAG: hypothetical protein KTR29_09925 [Rhodothermaceae bacterium]|nr:hypothetical protein [Rhodothermaceae bacterium]